MASYATQASEGFSEVFAFLPQNVRVKTTRRDTGAPCPVYDALDRREVKHWSRDVPPFHPGCRCVVVAIDDASNFPPGWKGRQPRRLLSDSAQQEFKASQRTSLDEIDLTRDVGSMSVSSGPVPCTAVK